MTPTPQVDELDRLCERLAWWCRTRRFYGRTSVPPSLLGRLAKKTRPIRAAEPDAACSAQLAAMYIALIGQPPEALDRRVFELHFLHRVANVKAAAASLGISRQHWYRLLREFQQRLSAAAGEIMNVNAEALRDMERRNVIPIAPGLSTSRMSPPEVTSSCSPTGDTLAQNQPQFR